MVIIAIILSLIFATDAHAMDKKLGTTNSFKINITDTTGNGIAGLDVVTPFTDFAIKVKCGSDAIVTMDESGDTVVDEGGGVYFVTTNDTLTTAAENECLHWAVGEGNYSVATAVPTSLIAKTPEKFKAVGATMSMIKYGATCDISASTSGTSFTIATCLDEDGTAIDISLYADNFVGSYMVGYTNGSSQCNVVNRGVFVGDVTTGGLVTVKDSDLAGSGFPATPNTSNCGIRISP